MKRAENISRNHKKSVGLKNWMFMKNFFKPTWIKNTPRKCLTLQNKCKGKLVSYDQKNGQGYPILGHIAPLVQRIFLSGVNNQRQGNNKCKYQWLGGFLSINPFNWTIFLKYQSSLQLLVNSHQHYLKSIIILLLMASTSLSWILQRSPIFCVHHRFIFGKAYKVQ